MSSSSSAYGQVLSRLFARATGGFKLGLAPVRELLHALGDPQSQMRHVVVAGTVGKGSTSLLLAQALTASGRRVGHFTSPHLLRFTERIRIGQREIDPSQVVELFELIERHSAAMSRQPTFFECATAMAFLAFAREKVDIAVLEVGLGGRLDATNVVDRELAVITPIDLDHQQYLGDTIPAIAEEKAGVIQADRPVAVGPQPTEALLPIARASALRRAQLWLAPHTAVEAGRLVVRGPNQPALSFAQWPAGAFQRHNLATAVAACAALSSRKILVPTTAVQKAAAEFSWPGRYQWIAGVADVLLDGAHNLCGIQALKKSMAEDVRVGDRPVHAVFSALRDRPFADMMAILSGVVRSIEVCPVPSARSHSVEELLHLAPQARVHADTARALEQATALARADGGLVVVCGSLFLVGDALANLTGAPRDPAVDG